MKTAALLFAASFVLTALGLTFWGLGTYNELVHKDETVNGAWAQVQNVYQRRLDLIPNLVETVKGAAKYERETLTAVTRARAAATGLTADPEAFKDAQSLARFEAAQSAFGGALSRLLVSLERYPELRAHEGFQRLQSELADTEDRIAQARDHFNGVAMTYNAALRKQPAVLIARSSGFEPRAYFQAAAGAEQAPQVKF